MKLRTLFMLLIAGAFVFTACTGGPKADVKDDEPDKDPSESEQVEEGEEDDGLDNRIYGTWSRTATYTDGVNMGTDPATTMFHEDGTYTSIGSMCTVDGAYIVIDDLLHWTINSHNCPGYSGPYEYYSTFIFDENGDGLTIDTVFSGSTVRETFVRVTE